MAASKLHIDVDVPAGPLQADDGVGAKFAAAPEVQTDVHVVPVIEESLRVTKVVVDRGGHRITKGVETRDELVDELLRTEHVEIERRQVNTEISDGAIPQTRQEGDTLIVPVIEEVLVTIKRLVLVEEVRITRIQGIERKPQIITLRKEIIEVERLAAEDPSALKSS